MRAVDLQFSIGAGLFSNINAFSGNINALFRKLEIRFPVRLRRYPKPQKEVPPG
ncbi:MAG TPA: hypothetical protein VGL31_17575 [Xanthobacteraceae bacterium]|jgi:hypothetical protein